MATLLEAMVEAMAPASVVVEEDLAVVTLEAASGVAGVALVVATLAEAAMARARRMRTCSTRVRTPSLSYSYSNANTESEN